MYDRLIMQNPGFAAYHNNLGNIYFINGDYGRAIKQYDRAVKSGTKSILPYFNLSQVYSESLKFTEQATDLCIDVTDAGQITVLQIASVGFGERLSFRLIAVTPNLGRPVPSAAISRFAAVFSLMNSFLPSRFGLTPDRAAQALAQ